jgi:hypothetical protein
MAVVQSRICSYFKPICSHASREPTTFLSLPEHVRHQVYLQAGFVADASIRLVVTKGALFFCTEFFDRPAGNLDLSDLYSRWNGVPFACSNLEQAELDAYFDLRLVSRDVDADLVRCLISNNDILLDRRDILENALAVLARSPLGLLHWLRRLIVVLDGTITDRMEYSRLDKTLVHTSTSRKLKNFRPAWEKLIQLLAMLPSSSKLDLKLACNFENTTIARLILKPLEQLRVAKCTIQLSGKRNPVLEDIAREAVLLSTMGNTCTQGCFRFLDLPTELRQHILSFTDLVTPSREIMWSPSTKFNLNDREELGWYPCSRHGFCTTQMFVFPGCSCWQPPIPIFLVCRTMLQDARTVFYSSNRFIIAPPYSYGKPPTFRRKRFEASKFLTLIVPEDSLASLRDLEILFPSKDYSAVGIHPGLLDEWENVLRYAAPRLRKLTLSIYLGVENHPWPNTSYTGNLQASLQALCEVHKQIVRPLRQLRCLDRFFVTAWSSFNHEQWPRAKVEQYFREHAKNLETSVMGSTYDSEARGKTQRCTSKWLADMYKYGPMDA